MASVSEDRAANIMGVLRLLDVTDRNYKNWWADFTGLFTAYNTKVSADRTLHCSNKEGLDKELKTLAEKVALVCFYRIRYN